MAPGVVSGGPGEAPGVVSGAPISQGAAEDWDFSHRRLKMGDFSHGRLKMGDFSHRRLKMGDFSHLMASWPVSRRGLAMN